MGGIWWAVVRFLFYKNSKIPTIISKFPNFEKRKKKRKRKATQSKLKFVRRKEEAAHASTRKIMQNVYNTNNCK